MIYNSKEGEIDLSKSTRIYPAAVIEMYGEIAEMSLEWIDENVDKVKLLHYVLVFDLSPLNAEEKIKKVLRFDSKEELFTSMQEVAKFFEK